MIVSNAVLLVANVLALLFGVGIVIRLIVTQRGLTRLHTALWLLLRTSHGLRDCPRAMLLLCCLLREAEVEARRSRRDADDPDLSEADRLLRGHGPGG